MGGSKRLRLYRLDPAYVRELAKRDSNVMSIEPSEHKDTRPFVGVVVVTEGHHYCIPLSSPKPKHQKMKSDRDFSKILDSHGKLIGVLNFNNMIPVDKYVLVDLDLRIRKDEPDSDKAYKRLMQDQLAWCNDNRELIRRKAAKLYHIVTQKPQTARGLVRRCCDFTLLERVLKEWQLRNT